MLESKSILDNVKFKDTEIELMKALSGISDFWDNDGRLLKLNVINYASDESEDSNKLTRLLEVLLTNEKLKKVFFKTINGQNIFLKDKFIKTVAYKEFMPSSYTTYSENIGLSSNGEFIKKSKDVVLDFPHKDCVLVGGQTRSEQALKEVFLNETLANDEIDRLLEPKAFKNIIRYERSQDEKLIETKPTSFKDDNLLIKGNNLIALSSVLRRYEGQIKCIYIDPPYNTGSDSFKYNDNFNHSSWLTFMKNRLMQAYRLLRQDGYIFVQCDDNEQAYLKILLDEIFKRDNFINVVTVKTKIGGVSGSSEGKSLKDATEYINIFCKDKSSTLLNPTYIKTPLNTYIKQYLDDGKSWKYSSIITKLEGKRKLKTVGELTFYAYDTFESKSIQTYARENNLTVEEVYDKFNDKIFRTTNAQSSIRQTVIKETSTYDDVIVSCEYKPIKGKNQGKTIEILYKDEKRNMLMFLSDNVVVENNKNYYLEKVSTLWDDIQYNNISKEGGVDFPNGKKPESLIKRVLDLTTNKNDIVMDYHLGSGTTAAVAMKMQRKWIGIEQLNYDQNDSLVRLKNVLNGDNSGISKELDIEWNGGGSFVYCELAEDNNAEFINQLNSSKTKESLLALKHEIQNNAVIRYEVDEEKLIKNDKDFMNLTIEEQKKLLFKILDKNHAYINYSEIDDSKYSFSDEEKLFNKSFYEVIE